MGIQLRFDWQHKVWRVPSEHYAQAQAIVPARPVYRPPAPSPYRGVKGRTERYKECGGCGEDMKPWVKVCVKCGWKKVVRNPQTGKEQA